MASFYDITQTHIYSVAGSTTLSYLDRYLLRRHKILCTPPTSPLRYMSQEYVKYKLSSGGVRSWANGRCFPVDGRRLFTPSSLMSVVCDYFGYGTSLHIDFTVYAVHVYTANTSNDAGYLALCYYRKHSPPQLYFSQQSHETVSGLHFSEVLNFNYLDITVCQAFTYI